MAPAGRLSLPAGAETEMETTGAGKPEAFRTAGGRAALSVRMVGEFGQPRGFPG